MVRIAPLHHSQIVDEQPKERGETGHGSGEKFQSHYLEGPSLSLREEKHLAP